MSANRAGADLAIRPKRPAFDPKRSDVCRVSISAARGVAEHSSVMTLVLAGSYIKVQTAGLRSDEKMRAGSGIILGRPNSNETNWV